MLSHKTTLRDRIRAAMSGASPSRPLAWGRALLLPFVLVLALLFFLRTVNPHYPVRHWLFWHYALAWSSALVWALGCISVGHAVVKRLVGHTLPILEHVSTSFACGVFVFFLLMNVLGHLQLYNGGTFFALPLGLLALGARDSIRTARRFWRHRRHARTRGGARPRPFYFWPAVVYGLIGCGLVYVLILSPDNVQYDSRWKHLAMAEEYSVYGGLRRFPEGSTVATYPRLPSFLYGWAFLMPNVRLFDRVEAAAHLEYVTFLGTLLALPGLVRLLVPGRRAHLAWVARFLFPGFMLYDSALSTGADHIGAFFVIPVFTQLIRSWRELSVRHLILLAIPLTGVGLTKYTCTMLILPVVGGAVAIRMVWGLGCSLFKRGPEALRRNCLIGPLASLGVILALTTVHWLPNWIWYGDPAYPILYKYLKLRPWTEDAATLFEYGYKEYQFWRPPRNVEGLKSTLSALLNFSFIPHDYSNYHGKIPTFGSLFTLLLAALLFLRKGLRIWGVVVLCHCTIFIWFWTHHQDRYLQIIVPWMAAVVAAIVTKIWFEHLVDGRSARVVHTVTRVALVALVALQIVWGGDAWFFPTHAMAQSVPKRVLDLLAAGNKKAYESRFEIYPAYTDIAKHLPRGSRIVLHDSHTHLGIGATTVNDWGGWQFGISYGRLGTPEAVYQKYKEYGVTHVSWDHQAARGWDSLAGDLVFFEFATRHTKDIKAIGRARLGLMPSTPPTSAGRSDAVTVVGCDDRNYPAGLYRLGDLVVPVFGPKRFSFPAPRERGELDELLQRSDFLVVDPTCPEAKVLGSEKNDFELVAKRTRIHAPPGKSSYELYLRKVAAPKG